MNPSLIVGIWACAVTLGGAYGGVYWRQRPTEAAPPAHEEKLETRKIKPITVPIISDGVLKGYVSAEFGLLGPKGDPHGGGADIDPEGYFMDEAFRLIYAENKVDFTHIQKTDLTALTSRITENVNKRMGKEIVKETFVTNFTFVSRDDMLR